MDEMQFGFSSHGHNISHFCHDIEYKKQEIINIGKCDRVTFLLAVVSGAFRLVGFSTASLLDHKNTRRNVQGQHSYL